MEVALGYKPLTLLPTPTVFALLHCLSSLGQKGYYAYTYDMANIAIKLYGLLSKKRDGRLSGGSG